MTAIDPISLGILWDRLISIANEIEHALVRASFSSIVRESYDLACIVFDARGEAIAQGTLSQPVFIGTGPQTLRHLLDRFPPERLQPGDVLITNDAWMGTGHLWDITVVRPIYRGERLMGYTLTITHLPDIGGAGYSALNRSIYEEGLVIPPMKIVRQGRINADLIDIIRANVRVPEQVIGDVMANISATEVGALQILEFMDEYRLDDLIPLANAITAQSEEAMRKGILAVPDGKYPNTIKVESIGEPITLACTVTIEGDRLEIDFDGTSTEGPLAINVPLCYARALACYASKCLFAPNIPNNAGSVRAVEVKAPETSILNAQHPVATGARMAVGHFVVPLIFGALAPVMPHQAPADPGMITSLTVVGRRPDGLPFSTLFFSAGGCGALSDRDGNSATPSPANITTMPAETWEMLTGMRVVKRELLADSGGPGEFRGGLGQEIAIQNVTGSPVTIAIIGSRTDFYAKGVHGGRMGAARAFFIDGEPVHAKGRHELKEGQVITVRDAGGGGFGDPAKRPRASVEADLASGALTPEGARAQYGYAG